MTTLRVRRWSPSDSPESLWERLTEGWRDLVLSFASQPTFIVRDVAFAGPVASLSFDVAGVESRPRVVLLGSLVDVATGATSTVTLSWTWTEGRVVTTAFSGVPAGQWRATFLVIGGS